MEYQDDLEKLGVLSSFLNSPSPGMASGSVSGSGSGLGSGSGVGTGTGADSGAGVVDSGAGAGSGSNVGKDEHLMNENYDSMLEALPEELNLDFTSLLSPYPMLDVEYDGSDKLDKNDENNGNGGNNGQEVSNSHISTHKNTWGGNRDDFFKIDEEKEEDVPYEAGNAQSKPIAINKGKQGAAESGVEDASNQQNGEIAQFWDFNVDTLNMTPSNSSGSATISAPNSYSSDVHMGSNSYNNNNNHLFAHGVLGGGSSIGNSNPINSTSIGFANLSHSGSFPKHNSSLYSKATTATTMTFSTNATIKEGSTSMNNPIIKHNINAKRSTSQIGFYNNNTNSNDNMYALSAANTTNSVRKNSLPRQMSSTSLANYRKTSTSMQERGPDSDAVHCFNCKTYKTPLWRRSPEGKVLCNACGLFQKLHGTMRPLSLKTDVIRKRNSKKRKNIQQDPPNNQRQQPILQIQQQPLQGSMQKYLGSQASPTDTTGHLRRKNSNISNMRYNNDNRAGIDNNSSFTNLSSRNLNHHNARSSSYGNAGSLSNQRKNKSRRSSTSSNSSRSSSRSVVPILPKIPGNNSAGNSPLNIHSNSTPNIAHHNASVNNFVVVGSNSNSVTSSPRHPPLFGSNSPMQSRPLSSSVSKQGMSIPMRKLSRHASYSSSFMAASLQQLRENQDKIKEDESAVSNMDNSTWASKDSYDSPKPNFDLFGDSKDSPENIPDVLRSDSRISHNSHSSSHTSLLSQQIQNQQKQTPKISRGSQEPVSYKQSSSAQYYVDGGNNFGGRSDYTETLLQQRGVQPKENMATDQGQFYENMTYDIRMGNGNGDSKGLVIDGDQGNFNSPNNLKAESTSESDPAKDLDWLKFGI
ncbi:Nitrogen regulatory protein GLN3 [Nakaseomyces bracarensis]|uniref:Nitrogen regulatory protein GLN3 n=1 Tax=Nakaseomyces bracarensis TaxID=273131 RepID=A0ABR4NSL7_9SACH